MPLINEYHELKIKIWSLEDETATLKRKVENYRAISAALFVCVVLLTMVKAA